MQNFFTDPNTPYAMLIPGGVVDANHIDQMITHLNLMPEQQEQYAFCLKIYFKFP